MDLLNFDLQTTYRNRHHIFLPDCHYMFVGPTGCGKTNALLNLLLRGWWNYDEVFIYTINAGQSKYSLLQEYYNLVGREDMFSIQDPEEIVPVENLSDDEHKIVVFDDIKLDKKKHG